MDINFLLVIVVLLAICKLIDGFRKGMIKEIISLISLAILCAVLALIANAVSSYQSGEILNLIVVIVMLGALSIIHHLLGVVFFSAKVLSRLPIINSVNKLLGAVFGVFEIVLALWMVYTLIMMLDMGAIGQLILSFTEESEVLTWLYQHNWLAYGIEYALTEFSFVPLLGLK